MVRLSFSTRFFIIAVLSVLCVPIIYVGAFYTLSWLWLSFSAVVLVASVLLSRGNPIDPRVWFSVFGGLYSFSFFVLHFWGEETAENYGLGVFLSYIFVISAILAMWLVAMVKEPDSGSSVVRSSGTPKPIRPLVYLMFSVLFAYVIFDAILMQRTGLDNKRALNSIGTGLPGVGTALNWLLFLYVFLVWHCWHRRSRRYTLFLLVGALVVYVWAATGERDAIFKWVLITAFLFLFNRSVPIKSVYVLGALVFMSLPVTKDLGVWLSSDAIDLRRTENISVWLFKLEWKSSGENFDSLLSRTDLYKNIGLDRFLSDVARGFVPGELLPIQNTVDWYYSEYAPKVSGRQSTGAGFSYVGSWYVYGGAFAVILGGILFGIISWVLYLGSYKNFVLNSVYLVFVPLAIWSLRVDLSGFISSIIKQSILPALGIFAVVFILRSLSFYREGKAYLGGRIA